MMTNLLRLQEVKKVTGLSRSSIYGFIKQSGFPKQIKLGERAVAWDEQEIQEWIESRKQSSRITQ
jgi:prophage regulatory protein